jgi:hypothetical protein
MEVIGKTKHNCKLMGARRWFQHGWSIK